MCKCSPELIEQLPGKFDSGIFDYPQRLELNNIKLELAWYKHTAEKLWQLLDDIDTADDMAKDNDKNYRKICQSIMRGRFKYAESPDGIKLVFNFKGSGN
jgi:hypothetical protein